MCQIKTAMVEATADKKYFKSISIIEMKKLAKNIYQENIQKSPTFASKSTASKI